MLCEGCGENPAEIHFTEVEAGHKKTQWLCRSCAAERGLFVEVTAAAPPTAGAWIPAREPEEAGGRCPSCGMDLATFTKEGKLGCERCYEVFQAQLVPILRRLHQATEHRPPREEMDAAARLRRVLRALRRELADAVRQEEFELAARLRDEIRRYQEEAKTLEAHGSAADPPGPKDSGEVER